MPPRGPNNFLARVAAMLGLATAGAREEVLDVHLSADLAPREVRVYLPEGGVRPDTPLLVAFDGQMMPKWKLAEALGAVEREGRRAAPLVVAIAATTERIEEYGLAGRPDYAGRGRKAGALQEFVVRELVPAVGKRYGLELRPARTGVFGASMGGLAALDLAWRHPEVFGCAGVFSGSLWWRSDNSSAAAQQTSRLMHERVRNTAMPPPLRLWFQAGTKDETDDRDDNGVIDAIQDTTELMDELRSRGWRDGRDLAYVQVEGGEHNEATWARALPLFFDWALPERGSAEGRKD